MYGNSSATGDSNIVEDKKLFIGGLGWDTTEKQITDYFSKFGEIESINLKTNPNTGRSRGFAFIVFASEDAPNQIMRNSDHFINGRKIEAKKAIARTGKLFVGGLRPEISDDDVRSHFGQYGKVVDLEVPYDKQKNQRKGFCFVSFEQEHVANELLKNPHQVIKGVHIDLRKAQPKPEYQFPGAGYGGAGYGGAGRGGYNGYGGGAGYNNYGAGAGYGYDSYAGYGGGYGDYNGYGGGYADYPSYPEPSYPKGRGQYAPRTPY